MIAIGGHHSFQFDQTFGHTASNKRVYKHAAAEIVQAACDGGVGTIFMFGQTGSGKTHTMLLGHVISDPGVGELRDNAGSFYAFKNLLVFPFWQSVNLCHGFRPLLAPSGNGGIPLQSCQTTSTFFRWSYCFRFWVFRYIQISHVSPIPRYFSPFPAELLWLKQFNRKPSPKSA